ncbi:hypothetical protein, partial [Maribacter flavus]|uniref:hypothetical protein n=1 Tax=Maribacter flavus TaxID=1658664 RepID=UPI003D34B238
MQKYVLFFLTCFFWQSSILAQIKDNKAISELISKLKQDIRGPYKHIRWFCTDGSIRQPKDPCP